MTLPALPFVLLTALQIVAAEAESSEPWSVKQLVEYHQSIKQSLRVQDVYKLLYQANFGVEHILSDRASVLSLLRDELSSLDDIQEPLLERISTTDETVRVNLRQFKTLNLDPSGLVEVMFRSAEEYRPDTLMFHRQWNEFSALVRYGMLDFPIGEVKEFDERIAEGKLNPVHHSDEYAKLNKPAYRVVRWNFLEQQLGPLQLGK